MRLVIAIAALIAAPAFAQDAWFGRDKGLHFAAGAAVAGAVTAATRNERYGVAAGCAVGALKELHDSRNAGHTASFKDFAVTCLGAAGGAYATGWAISRFGGTTYLTYSRTF